MFGTRREFLTASSAKHAIERLIAEELKQPVIGTTCGGTHRMCGFGYTVRKRELRAQPMTGDWARAQKFVRDYVDYTYKLRGLTFGTRQYPSVLSCCSKPAGSSASGCPVSRAA